MTTIRTSVLALVLALTLPAAAMAAPKALAPYTTGVQFAHLHSDIVPDPGVRFGRLANGLTYMISKTKSPAGGAVVQMRVASGYVDEAEDEQGLNFMLVRLAFDGSNGIKNSDLHGWLASKGLDMRLGNDVALFPDSTKYQLDLTHADRAGLDDGLFVMRQIASELTLSEDSVSHEGTSAAGLALSSAGQMKLFDETRKWFYQGQTYSRRSMFGVQDVVMYTDQARMKAFYQSHYRPETTTLIVAGDVDADLVEARIKAAFGDWKAAGLPAAAPWYGTVEDQPARATVISYPGAPQMIILGWNRPSEDGFQTADKARRGMFQSMVMAAFNARMTRQVASPQSHLLSASMTGDAVAHTARSYMIIIRAKPGEDEAALAEALAAMEQLRAFGLTQSEIDLAYDQALGNGEARITSGDGVDATQRVALMSDSLDRNAVVNSAAQDLDFLRDLKPSLTPQTLKPVLDAMLAGDPGIALVGQGYGELDEAKVLASYKLAAETPPVPPQDIARVAWPYTDFGAPAAVAREDTLAKSGVTHLSYSNGLEVYLRPRKDVADDIAVRVSVRGGLSLFPADTKAPVLIFHQGPFLEGSLGRIAFNDIGPAMAGRKASIGIDVQDTVTALSGRSNNRDLPFQLQLLMAYLTDYRMSASEFERAHAALGDYYTSLPAAPTRLMASQLGRVVRGDDRRFGISTPSETAAMTQADAQAAWDKVLTGGPVTLTIAGDFDPKAVRAAIDATFAALPPRPAPAALPETKFVKGLDKTLRYRAGDLPNSLFVLAWPTTDYYSDLKTSVSLRVMMRVLDERFFAAHKEDYGMSSDDMFDDWQSNDRPGDGYMSVTVPALMSDDDSQLSSDVSAAFEDLLVHPATEPELTRARAWLVRYNDELMRDNAYWAIEMSHFNHPTGEADLTDYNDIVKATTSADVDKVAKAYLKTDDTMHVRLVPLDTSGGNAS